MQSTGSQWDLGSHGYLPPSLVLTKDQAAGLTPGWQERTPRVQVVERIVWSSLDGIHSISQSGDITNGRSNRFQDGPIADSRAVNKWIL